MSCGLRGVVVVRVPPRCGAVRCRLLVSGIVTLPYRLLVSLQRGCGRIMCVAGSPNDATFVF